jgi:trigger factor
VTLQVYTEENEQREVKMTVEVAEERIEQAMRQKARELAREVRIPGFRPGKAPYHVILRRVGKESLRFEVIDDMVPKLFEEAISQVDYSQEELYTRPSLDDMSREPLVLTFTLPLQPVATLGDYRTLRREIEPVEISAEAVDEALERIQSRYAEIEEVERPITEGDLVTIGGVGRLSPPAVATEVDTEEEDSETAETDDSAPEFLFDQERLNVVADSEKTFPGTSFVDNLLGLNSGDDANFIFTFPEDYEEEELAGREVQVEISVLKVQSRTLPALDDELAQKEGAETVAELRDNIREQLRNEAEEVAKNELLEYMVAEMRKEAVLAYPPAAVEEEIDGLIKNIKQQVTRNGWEWDDYLMIQGQSEETLRDELRQSATERVENRTLFMELLQQERVAVGPEDLDAALEKQLSKYEDERLREGMREYFLQGEGVTNLASDILNDKLYERVKAILTGTAPELTELQLSPLEDEEE